MARSSRDAKRQSIRLDVALFRDIDTNFYGRNLARFQHANTSRRALAKTNRVKQLFLTVSRPHWARAHRKILFAFDLPTGVLRNHARNYRIACADMDFHLSRHVAISRLQIDEANPRNAYRCQPKS